TLGPEPRINVLDFLSGQPCFLQKRLQLNPSRLRPFVGKPRGRSGCSGDRAETLWFEVVHRFTYLRSKLPNQGWHVLTRLWHITTRRSREPGSSFFEVQLLLSGAALRERGRALPPRVTSFSRPSR